MAPLTNDRTNSMPPTPGKRTARLRTTLTKRVIDTLQPTDKSWIAWDDKLTGFGVCIRPSGTKSFIVNYRTGDRGRKAPNKRVVIGKYGKTTPDQARQLARIILGQAAGGADPQTGEHLRAECGYSTGRLNLNRREPRLRMDPPRRRSHRMGPRQSAPKSSGQTTATVRFLT